MRIEKNTLVDFVQEKVNNSPYVLLTDYTGMRIPELNELRSRLSEVSAEYRVVKNNLLRRALENSQLPNFEGLLHGQTAIVVGDKDITAAAKVLKNFNAEFKKPGVKAGIMDKALLSQDEVIALADLPSREELLAKLLGLFQAPASTLVRLLNTPASQLAQVLKAKSEKDGAGAAE